MPSYDNITTLWLENNSDVVDPLAILNQMPANSRVRILGISYEAETGSDILALLNKLDSMRGLDENGNNTDYAQVSGSVHTAEVSPGQKTAIEAAKDKYPSLTITYDAVGKYMTTMFVERTLSGDYVNDRVTKVGSYAFKGISGLTLLSFPNATTFGKEILSDNPRLQYIHLPKFTTCSDSAGPLRWCSASSNCKVVLESYRGYDSGNRDMQATNFKWVDFHAIEVLIAGYFTYNQAMKALIIRNEKSVCTLKGTLSWKGTMASDGTGIILVPSALVESYKAATNWSSYASRIYAIEDYTVDGTVMGEIDETKI
jgi:hypothetical protein